MKAISHLLILLTASFLIACGGGSSSSVSPVQTTSNSAQTTAPTPTPSIVNNTNEGVGEVSISGKVTFDFIPHNSNVGLDYDSTEEHAARGIVVKLVNASDEILEQVVTNDKGEYSFTAPSSANVKVQAMAQLLSQNNQNWDVKVTDNISNNALYVLSGALESSGTTRSQIRNLHASSGWGGAGYSSERTAAPFAILNSVYEAIDLVNKVDSGVQFPALEIRWSPQNRAIIGNAAIGHIGTSGFHRDENVIYLLGDADSDTDEYDPHVVVHEWGHYFEHNLSRLDSIAGLHSLTAKLDPRLAFSEGWGNALAAIVTGDPNYKDSLGVSQSMGLNINFETINRGNQGWFNEASVSSLIYDVFDSAKDDFDNISAGFGPIYKAMTNESLRAGEAFVTIFSFSEALLEQGVIAQNDYQMLLEGQSIKAFNALGTGEINNGSIATALPVYKEAVINENSITVCSVDDAGNFNRLGNREFVFFDVLQTTEFTLSLNVATGGDDRDPDFNLWQNGTTIMEADSSGDEIHSTNLSEGRYIVEIYDFFNINGTSDKRGDGCFDFKITAS